MDRLPEASAPVCIHVCGLDAKPSPMAAPASGMPFTHSDPDETLNVGCPRNSENEEEEYNADGEEEEHILSSSHVPGPVLMAAEG